MDMWTGHNRQDLVRTLKCVYDAVMAVSLQGGGCMPYFGDIFEIWIGKARDAIFWELYATLLEACILFESDIHLRIFGAVSGSAP